MRKAIFILAVLMLTLGCSSRSALKDSQFHSVLGERAYIAFQNGELSKALELYQKSYEQARRADLNIRAVHDRFNMGRVFYEMNNLDSAIYVFGTVHNMMKIIGEPANASVAAAFVAISYAYRNEFSMARKWLNTSLSYGEKRDVAFTRTVAARLDWLEKQDEMVFTSFQEIAVEYKKRKNYSALARIYYYMAEIRFESGDMEAVKGLLFKSLSSLDMVDERYWRWNVLLALSIVHLCTGNEVTGNYYYDRAAGCLPEGAAIPSVQELSSCSWVQN